MRWVTWHTYDIWVTSHPSDPSWQQGNRKSTCHQYPISNMTWVTSHIYITFESRHSHLTPGGNDESRTDDLSHVRHIDTWMIWITSHTFDTRWQKKITCHQHPISKMTWVTSHIYDMIWVTSHPSDPRWQHKKHVPPAPYRKHMCDDMRISHVTHIYDMWVASHTFDTRWQRWITYYGVATVSRNDKIIGLFCRISFLS